MKQLACLILAILAFTFAGCSSSVEGEFFPDYGLVAGDIIRVEITGNFENQQWTEGQLYKKAALDSGTTMQLALIGYDIENKVSDISTAKWTTSDATIAEVDSEGNVTAVSAGDVRITVEIKTEADLIMTDAIDLTILPSPVAGKQWMLKKSFLPQAIWDHGSVIWNGHIYVAGGHSKCTDNSYQDCGFTDKVYYAPINKLDGTVGNFVVTTPLPVYLRGHTLLAYNGYLYVIGGLVQPTFPEPPYPDPLNFETILNEKVYFARVNDNGTIGSWDIAAVLPSPGEADPLLPPDKTGLFAAAAAINTVSFSDGTKEGYIFMIGGWSAQLKRNVNRVIIGPINDSDGKIPSWVHNDLSDLPYDLSKHTSVVASVNGSSYLYVIGGNSGYFGSQIFHHEIVYAKIAEDGILTQTGDDNNLSTWHFTTRSLPTQLIDHASVAIGRYIFVVGGRDGVETSDDREEYNKYQDIISYYIDDSGDLQLLQIYSDLPEPLFHHAVVADTSDNDEVNIYITGGAGGNTEDQANRKNTVYHFTAIP